MSTSETFANTATGVPKSDGAAAVNHLDFSQNFGSAGSVQRTLYLVILLLAVLNAGMATLNAISALDARENAVRIGHVNQTLEVLDSATAHFRMERDVLAAALAAPQPARFDTLDSIRSARDDGQRDLNRALERVATHGEAATRGGLVSAVDRAADALSPVRQSADRALELAPSERPDDIADRWQQRSTALVQAMHELSVAVARAAAADPRATQFFRLNHAIATTAGHVGEERAALARFVAAGQPIGNDDLQQIARLRGRIDAGWASVLRLAADLNIDDALVDEVRPFAAYDEARAALIAAGLEGYRSGATTVASDDGQGLELPLAGAARYPMTVEDWLDRSDTAVNALSDLQAAVTRGTTAYALAVADTSTGRLARAVAIFAIGLVAAALSFWFVRRRVVVPVAMITDAMGRLASGDHGREIPGRDRRDEIGAMARAVAIFRDNAIEVQRLAAEREELERTTAAARRDELNALADQFEMTVAEVVETVASAANQLETLAKALADNVEKTNGQASNVASASEQASTNVETVAVAAEELASSLGEISRQVNQSNEVAIRASTQAQDTNATVEGLTEAAEKIGEVVDLINEIASQTNLLALNATIEAARAGEAGKGFAVVAAEVKTLANQTAKATEEIASQISSIQGATTGAAGAIEQIAKTIREVNEIAASIATAVEEQGIATQEIARNVHEAARGTEDVSANITGVTVAARETKEATRSLLHAAGELSQSSDALRMEVTSFIEKVRAG